MDFQKLIDNLKHESRMFSYDEKYSESLVLDAIIRSLENALDKRDAPSYIEIDSEAPF